MVPYAARAIHLPPFLLSKGMLSCTSLSLTLWKLSCIINYVDEIVHLDEEQKMSPTSSSLGQY